jgi:hypothetical protein
MKSLVVDVGVHGWVGDAPIQYEKGMAMQILAINR